MHAFFGLDSFLKLLIPFFPNLCTPASSWKSHFNYLTLTIAMRIDKLMNRPHYSSYQDFNLSRIKVSIYTLVSLHWIVHYLNAYIRSNSFSCCYFNSITTKNHLEIHRLAYEYSITTLQI